MSVQLFLQPLDVLYLRGNTLFGSAGDHAEALMPPWPSVLSGALRSALLARSGADLGRFTDEGADHAREEYEKVLGTPTDPGDFRLSAALLARWQGGDVEPLFPTPADLVIMKTPPGQQGQGGVAQEGATARCESCERKTGGEGQRSHKAPDVVVHRLCPTALGEPLTHIRHGGPTPMLPVLVTPQEGKSDPGWWLTAEGWKTYSEGGVPTPSHLVEPRQLWGNDFRLGIARSRETFTAEQGRIYTTQAVAVKPGVGFLVGVEGCPAELLRGIDLVRLGGDGRGAQVRLLESLAWPRLEVGQGASFVLYLLTPGLFPGGWLPPGVRRGEDGTHRVAWDGFSARLACAAVPRAQVVSGWDLAAHTPKPAQRAVPAGAVYYFDDVTGDPATYAVHLWDVLQEELVQQHGPKAWDTVWKQRKAEGFNNVLVGRWPQQT